MQIFRVNMANWHLKGMHFQGRQLCQKRLFLLSKKKSILKRMNLLPLGANSFLLN